MRNGRRLEYAVDRVEEFLRIQRVEPRKESGLGQEIDKTRVATAASRDGRLRMPVRGRGARGFLQTSQCAARDAAHSALEEFRSRIRDLVQ